MLSRAQARVPKEYRTSLDLHEAKLQEAKLQGADLGGAYLSRADLSRADLRGAKVTDEQLVHTFQEGSTLPGGQKFEDWFKEKTGKKWKDVVKENRGRGSL